MYLWENEGEKGRRSGRNKESSVNNKRINLVNDYESLNSYNIILNFYFCLSCLHFIYLNIKRYNASLYFCVLLVTPLLPPYINSFLLAILILSFHCYIFVTMWVNVRVWYVKIVCELCELSGKYCDAQKVEARAQVCC